MKYAENGAGDLDVCSRAERRPRPAAVGAVGDRHGTVFAVVGD